MNETTDLVARLWAAADARRLPEGISLMAIPTVWPGALEAEAASEIERLRSENDHLRALIGAQDTHHCESDGCMQSDLGANGYRVEAEVWVRKYHAMKKRLIELGEPVQ